MTEIVRQLAAAIGLLTRLPIWRVVSKPPKEFAASAWAWPLVGAVIGGLAAIVYTASVAIDLSPPVAVCWTLIAQLLITGALHEDGLADTTDGFFGGQTRDRKLEIMRDSRIGTFGTLALLISTALRGVALASIASPDRVAVALVVSGCLARGAILFVAATTKPSRDSGLASGLAHIPPVSVTTGLALTLIFTGCALRSNAVLPLFTTALIALAMRRWAIGQIGGHTGDVLGATAVLTEAVLLSELSG